MLTRIITGVIGIALAALVIQTGGFLFGVCGIVLAAGAWTEYTLAFEKKGVRLPGLIGTVLIAVMCYSSLHGLAAETLLALVTASTLLILLLTVVFHGNVTVPAAVAAAAGVAYFGLSFAHLIALRMMETGIPAVTTDWGVLEPGCALIWITIIGTWASDTFAYFAGSFLGRHKLCPSISAGKTVEGFIGGLVGTTLSVAGLGILFQLNAEVMAVLGFAICVVATLGDLVESVVKRYTGIKDSSHLIPGHGGLWDRFDSLLYTAPFVFYFVKFVSLG